MTFNELHSNYISGIRIEEAYARYRLSCKTGTYCSFGVDQISNERHYHSCYELCIILSGKGSYIYNEVTYALSEGDIIISDPDAPHEIQSKDPGELRLLYIFIEIRSNDAGITLKASEDNIISGFLAGHSPYAASQKQLLSYILFVENYNSPKKLQHFGTYQALKNLILESLAALSDNPRRTDERTGVQNILEAGLDYIEANLHKKMCIADIARHVCTSQRNLEYIFHKHFNCTVIEYINEKKIRLACHYLEMYFSISDTGYMVGIANPSQFCRLFKKHMKMTPREYRINRAVDKNGMGRRL